MKLNKNFVQISLTALITSAVFIIPMANTGTGFFASSTAPRQRITWDEAIEMQKDYIKLRPLRVEYTKDNQVEREDLKGFTFPADSLREILDNNKSGTKPDSVYFQFGQEGEFGDTWFGFHHSGNIRLIAVGLKGKKLLITPDNKGKMSVFDKADPCPPNCPEIK